MLKLFAKLKTLQSRISWANLIIVADGGSTALANVLCLTIAARFLGAGSFSQFALLQLVVISASMIQRAFILAPGLAIQKDCGKGAFSPTLIVRVSFPLALIVCASVYTFRPDAQLTWATLSAAGGALPMDVIRYSLLTSGRRLLMLASNSLWGLATLAGISLGPRSVAYYLFVWGVSGLLIAAVSSPLARQASPTAFSLGIRRVWRLGKWSGIDAAMSVAANLLPMFAASSLAGPDLIGTYRLLQVTLGPLNIISSSLITIYSVDAWRLSVLAELRRFDGRVRRYSAIMLAGSFLYVLAAEVFVVAASGKWNPDEIRVCIIVVFTGTLGALTASYSAAALALGAQKSGALLRVLIVIWSMGVTALTSLGVAMPWNDPIAPATLFAAVAGVVGWSMAYRRALKKAKLLARAIRREVGSSQMIVTRMGAVNDLHDE